MKTLKQTDFLALKISALQSKQKTELLEVKNQIVVVQNYVLNYYNFVIASFELGKFELCRQLHALFKTVEK